MLEVLDQAQQIKANRSYPLFAYVARAVAELYNSNRRVGRIVDLMPKTYATATRSNGNAQARGPQAQ